jgi:hypothetical protein
MRDEGCAASERRNGQQAHVRFLGRINRGRAFAAAPSIATGTGTRTSTHAHMYMYMMYMHMMYMHTIDSLTRLTMTIAEHGPADNNQ